MTIEEAANRLCGRIRRYGDMTKLTKGFSIWDMFGDEVEILEAACGLTTVAPDTAEGNDAQEMELEEYHDGLSIGPVY